MSELQLQAKCFQWFHNTFPAYRKRLRRIKNELDNHPYKTKLDRMKQLNENKSTGVVSGDSDFYWVDYKNTYIELKVEGGKQSEEQKDFERIVTAFGHSYIVVWSFEEFQKVILTLLKK